MRYCKRLLIILFVFVSCYKQAKKEIYLLQQGYIGEVNIYFDRPDGVIVDSGDYYIYKINYNGLLMTSSSPNSGFLIDTNRLFFYSKGNLRVPISYMNNYEDSLVKKFPNEVYIFKFQVGRKKNIPFTSYCVDSLKNASKYYDERVQLPPQH